MTTPASDNLQNILHHLSVTIHDLKEHLEAQQRNGNHDASSSSSATQKESFPPNAKAEDFIERSSWKEEREWYNPNVPLDERLDLFRSNFLEWLKLQLKVSLLCLKTAEKGGKLEFFKFGRNIKDPVDAASRLQDLHQNSLALIWHGEYQLCVPLVELQAGRICSIQLSPEGYPTMSQVRQLPITIV